MALNTGNVRVARTGRVYYGPLGTTLPTTATAAPDNAFTDCGYVSSDGVTFTPTETVNGIFAWQNGARVATTRTDTDYTFKAVLIEDKGTVAKLWFRSSAVSVVSAGEWSVTPDTATTNVFSFLVDTIDGSKLKRFVIARGEITERGEQVFSNADAVGYDSTITCYYDETLGAPFKVLVADSNWGYS